MRKIPLVAVVAVVAAALGLGACGASGADCDKACRNYFTLHYWEDADKEIAKAPPEQREAIRKQKVEALEERMQNGLGMCTSQCKEAADGDESKCMINAKTVKEIEACVPAGTGD